MKSLLPSACAVGALGVLSVVAEVCMGSFPLDIFRFPLNVVLLALWFATISMLYRNRSGNAFARFMLSRGATWLTLVLMAVIGIVLGLQRKPSSTSWPVVVSILFVLTHLCFVILRGWRGAKGIRWRFSITHIGLLLALGAGFWGAPDREQRRMAVYDYPSNEAYTMTGELRPTPYPIELVSFRMEHADNGAPTHYEAVIKVDGKDVTLRVNHPYDRTLSEKIYLVSFGHSLMGETYAVIEIVDEPWQWATATGIIMLIAGAVLLFIQGPRRTENGKVRTEPTQEALKGNSHAEDAKDAECQCKLRCRWISRSLRATENAEMQQNGNLRVSESRGNAFTLPSGSRFKTAKRD